MGEVGVERARMRGRFAHLRFVVNAEPYDLRNKCAVAHRRVDSRIDRLKWGRSATVGAVIGLLFCAPLASLPPIFIS